jgi:hypothetical protein
MKRDCIDAAKTTTTSTAKITDSVNAKMPDSANVDPAASVTKLEDLFVRLDKIDRNQSCILAHLDTIDWTVFDASMAGNRGAVASA